MLLTRSDKGNLWTVCVLLLGLSGCVTVPKIELNQNESKNIKTIALLNVAEPQSEQVINMGGGAALFGLVGGIVQGATNSSHSTSYTKLVADQKIHFSPDIVETITNQLTASGFQVVYLNDQKPAVASDGKSDDFSSIRTDADAILVVWFTTVGYVSPPYSTSFQPWVAVRARLLDAKTKRDLYFKTFSGGYEMKAENSIYVPADSKYKYESFSALTMEFEDSINGLKESVCAIAHYISKDFSQGTTPTTTCGSSGLPSSGQAASKEHAPAIDNTTPISSTVLIRHQSKSASAHSAVPQESQPTPVIASMTAPTVVIPADIENKPQQLMPEPPASELEDYVSKTFTLNKATQIRLIPDPQAEVTATLAVGTQVNQSSKMVRNEFGDWCHIQSGDIAGWALASAIRMDLN